MIQSVPGSALIDASHGSAAARSKGPEPVAPVSAAAPAGHTSGAHDAQTQTPRSEPAAASAGSERPSDDTVRGGQIDIRV